MKDALSHRNLWSVETLTRRDASVLVDATRELRRAAMRGAVPPLLRGKNVALLTDDPASPSARAFQSAIAELGARIAMVHPPSRQVDGLQTLRDTARLLGQLYSAIECQDMSPEDMREVELNAGIPTFNHWAHPQHFTGLLADLASLQELCGTPLDALRLHVVSYADASLVDTLQSLARLWGMHLETSEAVTAPAALPGGALGGGMWDDTPEDEQIHGETACIVCAEGHLRLRLLGATPPPPACVRHEQAAHRRHMLQALVTCTTV